MNRRDPVSELKTAVLEVVRDRVGELPSTPSLDPSDRPEHGDFASNVAMLAAPVAGRPPREVAEEVGVGLAERLGDSLERFEVAGPGFLNLFMTDRWYRTAVATMFEDDGPTVPPVEAPRDTMVEFVSANPTGPLTAASGRHAAYGDALTRILRAVGHPVATEYYVNDGGSQIEKFAASIAARMEGVEPPEDGYRGEYVNDLAERARSEGISPEGLGEAGVSWMLDSIRASLERFRVGIESFFSERSLYDRGLVEKGIERLGETGSTYESEGALWLRTTDFGDDKDRVLIRSGGEPTYFGADVAYHADKISRGHTLLLDVLGADHHGYVTRMDAAVRSLGGEEADFEAMILQMIHLVEGGERTKMSKRAGDIVTLDELVEDIGVDAARFFLLQRSHDRTMELDLDLARTKSSDNPVYYVQYAHARIRSILRKAADAGVVASDALPADPVDPSEKALVALLLAFPGEVHVAAEKRAPHRICAYSMSLAAAFHAFYRDCQVVGASGRELEESRLALCEVTGATIRRSLDLLGISAPESM
jgi:arginyl-tRNA synthetase